MPARRWLLASVSQAILRGVYRQARNEAATLAIGLMLRAGGHGCAQLIWRPRKCFLGYVELTRSLVLPLAEWYSILLLYFFFRLRSEKRSTA